MFVYRKYGVNQYPRVMLVDESHLLLLARGPFFYTSAIQGTLI